MSRKNPSSGCAVLGSFRESNSRSLKSILTHSQNQLDPETVSRGIPASRPFSCFLPSPACQPYLPDLQGASSQTTRIGTLQQFPQFYASIWSEDLFPIQLEFLFHVYLLKFETFTLVNCILLNMCLYMFYIYIYINFLLNMYVRAIHPCIYTEREWDRETNRKTQRMREVASK